MKPWNSLQDLLRDRAQAGSGAAICYTLGNTNDHLYLSYKDLYALAKHNSRVIQKLAGFQEYYPIILNLDTHVDTIIWFWSILLANGIPVVLGPSSNVNNNQEHVAGLSQLLNRPICITTSDLRSVFDTKHGMHVHTVDRLQSLNIPTQQPEEDHFHFNQGRDTAVLMLTSGSTGTPKAVCLSHHQILAAVAGKAAIRPPIGHLPLLNWIGLDHVASLVEIHIQALWLGVDQVHVHAADVVSSPTTFLSLLHQHKVARSFAPGFFLAKLVAATQNCSEDEKWDLSNLSLLTSGGEDNDVDTCLKAASLLQRYGAPRNVIATGFGMTETCAGAIFNLHCPDYDIKRGRTTASLGRCMNGIEMRVTVPAHDMQLAMPNELGYLEIRGDVVFEGYYRNAIATAEAFTPDGWFRTGDQAMIDDEGSMSLVGRVKDVVNINGAKFALSTIQTALDQALSSRVARVVVFASRTAHTEQVTIAYVPHDWDMPPEKVLEIEFLAVQVCQLQVGASPLVFSISKESAPLIPMSALSKISRTKMANLYESGAFSADVNLHLSRVKKFRQKLNGAHDRETSSAEAIFIRLLAELSTVDQSTIGHKTSIFELGLSSIDVIRLKLRIDKEFGTSIPITTLMRHPTPSALASALGLNATDASVSAMAVSNYDPVVVLNAAGSKTPLWLVHPGIGEVLVFVGLAQHLASDDRPVYAFRAKGFEAGQERFQSIEETVDTYIAAIRQRQPQGPYAIAGYSYGTMLAFEMTKKLEVSNGPGTVQFLGSFNLPPHIKTRMRQLVWNNCLLHLAYFLGLTTEADAEKIEESEYCDMSRADALTYILELADVNRLAELGLDRAGLIRWTNVAYDLPHMATNYDPTGSVSCLDVFYATPLKAAAPNREEWINNHLSKWRDFCTSEPRFHEVGGAHYTMIGPDHVVDFSATLRSALQERGV